MSWHFIIGMALGLFSAQWCMGFFLYKYGAWQSVAFGLLNVVVFLVVTFIYNRFIDP